jgi:hypothetical protein
MHNLMLGLAQDSTTVLPRAAGYLGFPLTGTVPSLPVAVDNGVS